MNKLKKWLTANGYKFESKMMIGNNEGIFVSLEIIENHAIIGHVGTGKVLDYIKKRGFKSEYRGNYTSLLIWDNPELLGER